MSTIPPQVTVMLADPKMRLSHLLWHGVRELWMRLDDATQKKFIKQFGKKWVPPRPSRDKAGNIIEDNNAGLDFLYMHREMICMVNCMLEDVGGRPIKGWERLPRACSREFPAALDYRLPPDDYLSKDDGFWEDRILRGAEKLLSESSLKYISLAKLGTVIEFTVHAAMHQRFGGYSTSGDLRPGQADLLRKLDKRFNRVWYDTLLDAYSAHVDPLFWKIHGWIDAQIIAWEQYHDPVDWDAWMGPMSHCKMHMDSANGGHEVGEDMHDHAHAHPEEEDVKVEELVSVLAFLAPYGLDGFFHVREADLEQISNSPNFLTVRGPFAEPKMFVPKAVVAGREGASADADIDSA